MVEGGGGMFWAQNDLTDRAPQLRNYPIPGISLHPIHLCFKTLFVISLVADVIVDHHAGCAYKRSLVEFWASFVAPHVRSPHVSCRLNSATTIRSKTISIFVILVGLGQLPSDFRILLQGGDLLLQRRMFFT